MGDMWKNPSYKACSHLKMFTENNRVPQVKRFDCI